MWGERLKRIAIIFGVAILVAVAGKVFADWRVAKKIKGEAIQLPTDLVVQKAQEIGGEVLGQALKIIPGSGNIRIPVAKPNTAEANKVIEGQVEEIIEIVRQLPEDQLNQLKKQVFKDFCQEVLKE